MKRWARALFQPNLPLKGDKRITAGEEHIALSLKVATEGIVLLKNDEHTLPLRKGKRIALLGKGVFDYVKGGGGSGDVGCPYTRNLFEGLTLLGNTEIFMPLADYYKEKVEEKYIEENAVPGMITEAEVPEALLQEAAVFTDTAIYIISRFSAEGWDRSDVVCNNEFNPWEHEVSMPRIAGRIFPKGDFYLTKEEKETLDRIKKSFSRVIVVFNAGGIVETGFIQDENISAALFAWQGGMEGGLAIAKVLTGEETPSGKLPDTFAGDLSDYPSTENYHESFDYVEYTEDIYVGYRYFETIPSARDKVMYPFGFGLSYTFFKKEVLDCEFCDDIRVQVRVTNTGDLKGKEVVFLYYKAPEGKLDKPGRELLTYKKTRELLPGESMVLSLTAPVGRMASFDDRGVIKEGAFVLEKGEYHFYLGGDIRTSQKLDAFMNLDEDRIIEECSHYLRPTSLSKRMLSDGSYEKLDVSEPLDINQCVFEKIVAGHEEAIMPGTRGRDMYEMFAPVPEGKFSFTEVAEGKRTIDEFLGQLSDDELIHLLGGQPNTGVANTFGVGNMPEYNIPSFMTADGPAGVRIAEETGIQTTAWPCATLLASTFDTDLVEQVGKAGGEELIENNLYIWLTPGMNIHRNPMCGRNFEYYSEDPVVTGMTAAALVRGIQSNGVAACPKHFAANNKETNRKHCDSRVSERALREIYLKGFRIMIDDSKPKVIMSSYNAINGQRASESKDLLTGILREEWDFDGMVLSDWWNRGEHYKEILAGNDVKMGTGYLQRVKKAMEMGALSREDLLPCAKHVLEFILSI